MMKQIQVTALVQYAVAVDDTKDAKLALDLAVRQIKAQLPNQGEAYGEPRDTYDFVTRVETVSVLLPHESRPALNYTFNFDISTEKPRLCWYINGVPKGTESISVKLRVALGEAFAGGPDRGDFLDEEFTMPVPNRFRLSTTKRSGRDAYLIGWYSPHTGVALQSTISKALFELLVNLGFAVE